MKTMFREFRWAWVGLLLCGHLCAIAQIYTWTDKSGRKHFGDDVSTPENQRSTPVKIPSPNTAKRFEPNAPLATSSGSDAPADGPTPFTTSATDPKAKTKDLSGVAARQEACKAEKQAYQASAACYAECGISFCSGGLVQGGSGPSSCGRNNVNCGHCKDLPMPRC
jgi:hypothetical protein